MKSGFVFLSLLPLLIPHAGAGLSEPDTVFFGRVLHQGGGEPRAITAGQLSWSITPPDGSAPVTVKTELSSLANGLYNYQIRVPRQFTGAGQPGISVPAGLPVLADAAVRYQNSGIKVNGFPARPADPSALSFSAGEGGRGDFIHADLIVDFPLPDSNQDGIPDWWCQQYDLDPLAAISATRDTDHDGVSDRAEYAAGTNPVKAGTAPQLAAPSVLTIPENGRAAFALHARDSDTPPALLIYKLTALPAGLQVFLLQGAADGRTAGPLTAGSTFTQSEADAGRVILTASAPLRDQPLAIALTDEIPGRAPLMLTLPCSTVSRQDLLASAGLRDSVVPAAFTLQDASASATGGTLRAPSGPADAQDTLLSAAYPAQWIPRHGADEARLLLGSAKADTLLGSGENDVLSGGGGDNTLRGYAGADRFVLTASTGNDSILDFSAAEGDVLDVSALLTRNGDAPLSAYLKIAPGPVLMVNADGAGGDYTDAAIRLPGTQLPASLDEAWDSGLIDTGTITPRATLFVSASDASEENLRNGLITFRRRGDTTLPLSVPLSITGTATPGLDYIALPSQITFAAGAKATAVTVTPLADNLREPSETVQIALASGPDYDLDTAAASATVNLLDLPSRVWLEVTSRTGYQDSLTPAQVLLRRSGTLSSPLTVMLNTAGTATRSVDYRISPGVLTFTAGQDVLPVSIEPLATATLSEGFEDVILSVKPDAAYLFGETPQVQTILATRPRTFDGWMAGHFPSDKTAAAPFIGTQSDADGDGFPLLMEFALNLNPAAADAGENSRTTLVFDSQGHPGLEYRRHPASPELNYQVSWSTNLTDWQPLTAANSMEPLAMREPDGMERCRAFLKTPPSGSSVYLRLKVTR